MTDYAEAYYKNLITLIGSISIRDKKGNEIGLSAGVEMSCRLITKPDDPRRKIMLIGNGGSSAIASHMAIDFWKNGGIKATAFNDSSLLTCVSNDFGYRHVFEKPIEMFAEKGDVLIAISSSGRSENILRGTDAARLKGCNIITLSGFSQDNPLRLLGDVNFYVLSEAYGHVEIIHQSICHCILDIIMVKQGKLNKENFKHVR